MRDLLQLEQDKRDLQEALAQHKGTKYKLLIKLFVALPVFIFTTLLLSIMPSRGRGKSIPETVGRENYIFFVGTFFCIIFIWGAYKEYNNYKNTISDIEYDIEVIDSKIAKLKEENRN
ncbi:hypothetical protein [Flavobacterium sp. GCM10023249]|uniref:hypothetical protein n=1 Tax=unclassified Flavobacterium TaxID=196869 RepID=UPI00360BB1A6